MAVTHRVSPYEHPLLERLDWAQDRVDRLDEATNAFFKDHAVTIWAKPNAEATEYVIRVKTGIGLIPADMGLMIGEIVHHARSTLDWLAWSIVTKPCDSTTFPLWPKGRGVNKAGKPIKPTISGGLSKLAASFVEQVQPYVAWSGDPTASPLHWLDEMDKIDKHRHLVPAACSDSGHFSPLGTGYRGTAEVEPFRSKLEPSNKLARVAFSEPNPGLDFNYQPFPYISVDGIAPSLDELNIVGELRYAVLTTVRRIVIAAAGAELLLR